MPTTLKLDFVYFFVWFTHNHQHYEYNNTFKLNTIPLNN